VEVLVEKLTDANSIVRVAAFNAIADLDRERLFTGLVSVLRSDDQTIRRDILFGLWLLRDERCTSLALPLLKDTDSSVRLVQEWIS
jgi:HEAT repeat protein